MQKEEKDSWWTMCGEIQRYPPVGTWWRSVENLFIWCFYLLRVPLNDSCHSSKRYISRRRFLTVINCIQFPYLICIFVGNGCSNHHFPPSPLPLPTKCEDNRIHFNVYLFMLTHPKCIDLHRLEWFEIMNDFLSNGDTLQYSTRTRTHIYTCLTLSIVGDQLIYQRQFSINFMYLSVISAAI